MSSVSAGTDETGAVVGRQMFAPYGEAWGGDEMAGVPWGWATHRPGEGHGLVFMRARWYAPGVGRFVSADPIPDGAGTGIGHARYDYGRGNPISQNDPSGHCARTPSGEIVGCDRSSATMSTDPLIAVSPIELPKPPQTFLTPPPSDSQADPRFVILMFEQQGYVKTKTKTFTQITAQDVAAALGQEMPVPIAGHMEGAIATECYLIGGSGCQTFQQTTVSGGVKGNIPGVAGVQAGIQSTSRSGGALEDAKPYVSADVGPPLAKANAKLTSNSLEAKIKIGGGGGGVGVNWQVGGRAFVAVRESEWVGGLSATDWNTLSSLFGPAYQYKGVAQSNTHLFPSIRTTNGYYSGVDYLFLYGPNAAPAVANIVIGW